MPKKLNERDFYFQFLQKLCKISLNSVYNIIQTVLNPMNFLNFLTSGAGIFNFNLQNLSLNTNTNPQNRNQNHTFVPFKEITKNTDNSKEENSVAQTPESNELLQRILTSSQAEMLTHQQQLINQYMHLNIQLLSKKIETLEKQPEKKQENSSIDVKSNKKKIKKENVNCEHHERQHYAKGMCNNCYHKNGRTKKPWKCQHQKLYANGLCQNCYINKYNKMKRQKYQNSEIMNSQGIQSRQENIEPKIQDSL